MSFDILGTSCEARFNKIHIRKVYACLAVTCHLHFWQNDRDFLRATVVTRGWNGYRNKSQHRKSTLEKKVLPPFQQGFEPATFQSRVRRSNHWAIPAPCTGSRTTLLFKLLAVIYRFAELSRGEIETGQWLSSRSCCLPEVHTSLYITCAVCVLGGGGGGGGVTSPDLR